MLKLILKPLSSLTLTVILLGFSMVLIYAGTLAQVDRDIWRVQHEYFHTLFCWLPLQDLAQVIRAQCAPVTDLDQECPHTRIGCFRPQF